MKRGKLTETDITNHYQNTDLSKYPLLIVFKNELLPGRVRITNLTGEGMYAARQVVVNGRVYESVAAAARSFGITHGQAINKLKYNREGWYYA